MLKRLKSAGYFWLSFFILSILTSAVLAATFPPVPNPIHYVNDYTQTLSAQDKQILERKLIDYSQKTSSQIAVVLVPTTAEYAISDYTFSLGNQWGIGRKQLKNGVLFLVAIEDRKVFIATGQGLEGVLPDAFLSQVIRKNILPYFKKGQYAQGINAGLNQIIAASQGEFDANKIEQDPLERYIPFFMVLVFILFVLFGEISWRRKPYISPTNNHQIVDELLRQSARRRGNSIGYGAGLGGISGMGGSTHRGNDDNFGGGGFDGGGAGGSW